MQAQDKLLKPKRLRILGILGMACAPWMLIDFIENGLYDRFKNTAASGVHNLLFITGCMCSVLGLYYVRAAGANKTGTVVLIIQLLLLGIANCWNLYEIIHPDSEAPLFRIIGFFWPVSCLFLIITGIFILRAGKLKGWRKIVPLLAGLWFPFMMLLSSFSPNTLTGLVLSGAYAAITFAAMGFVVLTLPDSSYNTKLSR